jgi:tetratricopeptide (TPR) repeat protein
MLSDEVLAGQSDTKAQIKLGRCYADGTGVAEDYSKAEDLFRKAAELGDAEAKNEYDGMAKRYFSRGDAYYNKGNYDQAIEDYTKAINFNPDSAIEYCYRGDAYKNKGNYDQAIADYTKAISFDPNNMEAYFGRGVAYKSKGNYDLAIADYNKAITLNTSSSI